MKKGDREDAAFPRKLICSRGTTGSGENDLDFSSRDSGLQCLSLATNRTLGYKIFKRFLYSQVPIEN